MMCVSRLNFRCRYLLRGPYCWNWLDGVCFFQLPILILRDRGISSSLGANFLDQ